MIDWFINALQTNEFMQAAVVAAPVSILTYTARNVPLKIWDTIRFFFSYDVVFRSDQESYYYVNEIIRDRIVSRKWSRDFTYDTQTSYDVRNDVDKLEYSSMNIGYGKHWGKYKGHPVIVWRELEESNQTEHFKETLTLRFIGRSSAPAEALGEEIDEAMSALNVSETVKIRNSAGGGWMQSGEKTKRSLSTVFTSGGQGQQALDFLRKFEESRETCLSKGLPWHTGILLAGPPGTGKTSLIHALASETGRDLRVLNLSSINMDSDLTNLMCNDINWSKVLLVIEDIDVARAAVNRETDSDTVSLSTLLNVLDGFSTPEGLVTIATTNHVENLDPALIRSGRFDLTLNLGPLGWDEAKAMADLLLGENNQFGTFEDSYVPIVGAELREKLLRGNF